MIQRPAILDSQLGYRNLLLLLLLASVSAICTEDDAHNAAACLRPVTEILQNISQANPRSKEYAMPLFKFRSSEIARLCTAYSKISTPKQCFNEDLVFRCKDVPVVNFVHSLLGYACGERNQTFIGTFSCMSLALDSSETCSDLLKGNDFKPGAVQKAKCKRMKEFFDCGLALIEDDCAATPANASVAFRETVDNFRCDIDAGLCEAEKQANVSTCLAPLLGKWQEIKETNSSLSELNFPLFQFSVQQLDVLCTAFQGTKDSCLKQGVRQHCRSLPILRFLEANLGYSCRLSNSAFFRRFKCIAKAINAHPECLALNQGAQSPGSDHRKCDGISEYYECVRKPVQATCTEEAVKVIEDAIENYGCKLDKSEENAPATFQAQEVCSLPIDIGTCTNSFERWSYDPEQQKCQSFNYGGCGGNANNFASRDDCENACHKENIAVTPRRRQPKPEAKPEKTDEIAKDAESDNAEESESNSACDDDSVSELADCLDPLLTKWQSLLDSKPALNSTNFKLFLLSPPEIDVLCTIYHAQDDCYANDLKDQCSDQPLVRFVETTFGYACRIENDPFFRQFICIQNSIRESPGCDLLNKASEPIADQKSKCLKAAGYYSCLRAKIQLNCDDEALRVFEAGLRQFGCQVKSDGSKAPPRVEAEDPPLPPPANEPSPELETGLEEQLQDKLSNSADAPSAPDSLGQFIREDLTNATDNGAFLSANKAGNTNSTRKGSKKGSRSRLTTVNPEEEEESGENDDEGEEDSSQDGDSEDNNVDLAVAFPSSKGSKRGKSKPASTSPRDKQQVQKQSGSFRRPEPALLRNKSSSLPLSSQQQKKSTCPPVDNCNQTSCVLLTVNGGCQICACTNEQVKASLGANPASNIPPIAVSIEDPCTKSDRQEISDCIKPLVKTWQDILKQQPDGGRSRFGIFRYGKHEMTRLCVDYRWLHESCFSAKVVQHCEQHPFMTYIEAHFGYACSDRNNGSFFQNYECINLVTVRSTLCLEAIQGFYAPGKEEDKCRNMDKYYRCMAENIATACNSSGLETFRSAIEAFGCSVESSDGDVPQLVAGEDTVSAVQKVTNSEPDAVSLKPLRPQNVSIDRLPRCDQNMEYRVRNCFNGLLDRWLLLGRENPNITNLTFPLYTYSKLELLDLCDHYAAAFLTCNHLEIRACQDDPVLKFAIENMGYACGKHVIDFFTHFDCVVETVKQKPKCLQFVRGQFHPSNVATKCANMPKFYVCVKESLVKRCKADSITVVQESIKSFGCNYE